MGITRHGPNQEVVTALRWLTGCETADRRWRRYAHAASKIATIVRKPRVQGLFVENVNGDLVRRALERCRHGRSLNASVLLGLGQIAAQTNEDLLGPTRRLLNKDRRAIGMVREAVERAAARARPKAAADGYLLAAALACDRRCGLEPFLSALDAAQGRHFVRVYGHHDFTFVLKLLGARGLVHWLTNRLQITRRDSRALSIGIALATIREQLEFGDDALGDALTRAQFPALQYLGAAYFIVRVNRNDGTYALTIADCMRRLTDNGVAQSEAMWMVAQRLKQAAAAKAKILRQQKDNELRISQLQTAVTAATPSMRQNVNTELESCRKRVPTYEVQLSASDVRIRTTFQEFANVWPSQPMTQEQMLWLDDAFESNSTLRLGMAALLSHRPIDQRALHERNVLSFKAFLTDGVQSDSTHLRPDQVFELINGATESLLWLHPVEASKPVGQAASQLVFETFNAVSSLLMKPYAQARDPGTFQAVMPMGACAYIFAWAVSLGAATDARTQTAVQLRKHALSATFNMLCAWQESWEPRWVFEELSILGARELLKGDISASGAPQWIFEGRLPARTRALVLWMSLSEVERDVDYALALLKQAFEPPVGRRDAAQDVDFALNLLRLVIESIGASSALRKGVESAWHAAWQEWSQSLSQLVQARVQTYLRSIGVAAVAAGSSEAG